MKGNVRNETNFDIMSLLLRYITRRVNAMHILFVLAFLTFGIGDGLTAAVMMANRGIGAESNLFFAGMYSSSGLIGVITAKIVFTAFLLMASLLVYWRSQGRSYWMVNGFLMALTLAGTMASIANLQAATGLPFMSPEKILLIYLGMMFVFVEIGDFVDTRKSETSSSTMTGTKPVY
ncbi:MAG: hypothetical protein FIB08_10710 [Candidatus Methanoperedens sp.]|nr:hypothetical protein [Candidatus Methanoperedens sp.]